METGYKDFNFDDTLLVALTTGIVPPSNAFPSVADEAAFFRKLCEQQRATNVVLQAEVLLPFLNNALTHSSIR
jgi:hypothetical protein